MAVKNVIFDFGGVLVDWNPRYLYRPYFGNDEDTDYFLQNVYSAEWNADNDRGVPLAENVRRLQERHPDYAEAIALFEERWGDMLGGDIAEGVALLKEVKRLGFGVFGLTNWEAETIGIAYERFGFFGLFDGIVVSGEEGVIKPEHAIYRLLLERYGLKAEECLFIDDNPANTAAAREVGIAAVDFDDPPRAVKEVLAVLSGESRGLLDRTE